MSGSIIRMNKAQLPVFIREKEETLLVCKACKHTFQQEVLFIRKEEERIPIAGMKTGWREDEPDEVLCPECGDTVEVAGLRDFKEELEDLKEDSIEHFQRPRIETNVRRKSLYPEYADEKGALSKRLAEMDSETLMMHLLHRAKPRRIGNRCRWICYRKTGISLNLEPTEAPSALLSPEGIYRVWACARTARDWDNWRFSTKSVLFHGKPWKTTEWIQAIIPLEVLPKEDIQSIVDAVHYSEGRAKIMQVLGTRRWSTFELALEKEGVPPQISGVHNREDVMALSESKVTAAALGLAMNIFPPVDRWRDTAVDDGLDEKWFIQNHAGKIPYQDKVRVIELTEGR